MQIQIHKEKCTGCGQCVKACSQKHGEARLAVESGIFRLCRQCKKPQCAYACTYELISRNHATGALVVNLDECQACHACQRACPFNSVFLHPQTQLPLICDLCGGAPECVKACATGALCLVK